MKLSERTVWISAAIGVAALALFVFMPQSNDTTDTGSAGTGLTKHNAAPAVVPPSTAAMLNVKTATDRFKVVGMMNSGTQGIALISVDGQPARMLRVGETIEGDVVLRDVSERGASIGSREGGAVISLGLSQAIPPTVSAPEPAALAAPQAPLADKSAQAQQILRKIGSKHAPLSAQPAAEQQNPANGVLAPVDDGRWRPPGQQ
jgi:hypothetical protein